MRKNNLLILISLIFVSISCVVAQKSITLEELRNMNKKVKKIKAPKDAVAPKRRGMKVKLTEAMVLAEGSQSKFEKPFIYIARTKEEYSNLKSLVDGFSSDKEIDFNKHAVVAAFAGIKSTGGHSIVIYKLQGRVNVLAKAPSKDMMVTQAITQPYKIAVVSVEEEDSLNIAASKEFTAEMTKYKVTSAKFEFMGGFTGMEKKFDAEGTVGVMKSGEHYTFAFELSGKGSENARKLFEMASVKMDGNSGDIARVEAGNFINKPHPPFNVSVLMDNDNLTMKFEPGKRGYVVSDGFEGRGMLKAVKAQ